MKSSNTIVETDDDNYPKKSFFEERKLNHYVQNINNKIGLIYTNLFSKKKNFIWPRGLPLDQISNIIKISKYKEWNKFYIQQRCM